MKKALLLLSVLMFMAPVKLLAEESPVISVLNLDNPLKDPRLGMAWNTKGESRTTAYIPFLYVNPGGVEYATFNFGGTNDNADGKKAVLVSFGPRIDSIFSLINSQPNFKKNFSLIGLPPIQISPTIMTSDFRRYTWWLTIASKFGSK